MALSNINSDWKNDLYPLIDKSFSYAYENRMNKFMQIMSEENIKHVDYRMSGSAGFGELKRYDGVNLTTANQKRGFVTVITPQEFQLAADIGMKAAKIDRNGEINKVGTYLGGSASMSIYMNILRMFGKAFDATQLGGDGKAWAASDHPNASKGDAGGLSVVDSDSGTYDNTLALDLSISSITTAQTRANRFVTPDGLPLMCDFQDNGILLVSPELEPKAIELCGKEGKMSPEKLPETAENGANPVYGLKYMVVGGGNEGFSAKMWAIADRSLLKETTKVVYITRPGVMNNKLDNALIERFTAYVDYQVGFGDARSIIFSTGK